MTAEAIYAATLALKKALIEPALTIIRDRYADFSLTTCQIKFQLIHIRPVVDEIARCRFTSLPIIQSSKAFSGSSVQPPTSRVTLPARQ